MGGLEGSYLAAKPEGAVAWLVQRSVRKIEKGEEEEIEEVG